MEKSAFYKKLLSERGEPARGLNEQGYPDGVEWRGTEITTEEQWTGYLSEQMEVDDFCKVSEEAATCNGVTFEENYVRARVYPDMGDQLDKLYHDIDDGKLGEDAKTGDWYLAVKQVKVDHPKNGTLAPPPDTSAFNTDS